MHSLIDRTVELLIVLGKVGVANLVLLGIICIELLAIIGLLIRLAFK